MTTDSREQEKRDRFARIFPSRIDKLREGLRIIGNCSNASNYSWDRRKIQLLFALLLKEFATTARAFGVTVNASVDGTNINDLSD